MMADFERAQLELAAAVMDALDDLPPSGWMQVRRYPDGTLRVSGDPIMPMQLSSAIDRAYEAEKAASKVGA